MDSGQPKKEHESIIKELLTVAGIIAMPAMKEVAMKAAGVPTAAAVPGVTPEYQVTVSGMIRDAVKMAQARLDEINAERAAKGLTPLDAGFADLLDTAGAKDGKAGDVGAKSEGTKARAELLEG